MTVNNAEMEAAIMQAEREKRARLQRARQARIRLEKQEEQAAEDRKIARAKAAKVQLVPPEDLPVKLAPHPRRTPEQMELDRRPKNSDFVSRKEAREAIGRFVTRNALHLERWLHQVAEGTKDVDGKMLIPPDPGKAFALFQSVIEYHIPKIARVEGDPIVQNVALTQMNNNIVVKFEDAD